MSKKTEFTAEALPGLENAEDEKERREKNISDGITG